MRTLNLLILPLLLISACVGPNYSDKYMKMEKPEFNKPTKDAALVYFFRPRFKGNNADVDDRVMGDLLVFMDKKIVGILAKDTYFITLVKPGSQLIWTPRGYGSLKRISIWGDFKAGDVYFVGFHRGFDRDKLIIPLGFRVGSGFCYLWDIKKSNQNQIENLPNIGELSLIKTTEKGIEELQLSQRDFIEKNYIEDSNEIGRCN